MVVCRARGMIVHDNKILLVKHKGTDFFALPGGKIENNETVHEAAHREIVEEIGITPQGMSLVAMQNFFGGGAVSNIDFIYRVDNAADFTNLSEAENSSHAFEREDLQRIDINDMNANVKPIWLLQLTRDILDQGIEKFIINMHVAK